MCPKIAVAIKKNEIIEAQSTTFCYIEEFPTMGLKKYFNQPRLN